MSINTQFTKTTFEMVEPIYTPVPLAAIIKHCGGVMLEGTQTLISACDALCDRASIGQPPLLGVLQQRGFVARPKRRANGLSVLPQILYCSGGPARFPQVKPVQDRVPRGAGGRPTPYAGATFCASYRDSCNNNSGSGELLPEGPETRWQTKSMS